MQVKNEKKKEDNFSRIWSFLQTADYFNIPVF